MKRTSTLLFVILLFTPILRADSDAVKNCVAEWTTACSKNCATAKCVSECTTQANAQCAKNLANPQDVFTGPVTAAAVAECNVPPVPACSSAEALAAPPSCSTVSGTVANPQFWGGTVTIFVICPQGTPTGNPNEVPTLRAIGRSTSSITDGTFSMEVTNSCSGQTGCYGLIAVTPPAGGDPGWTTCTDHVCPAP